MLLLQLKDDAVALVDVLAPTDFILNSPMGNADGQVRLQSHLQLRDSFWQTGDIETY